VSIQTSHIAKPLPLLIINGLKFPLAPLPDLPLSTLGSSPLSLSVIDLTNEDGSSDDEEL